MARRTARMLVHIVFTAILLLEACCVAKKFDNSTGSTTTPDPEACFSSWIDYYHVRDNLPDEAFTHVTHPMRTIVNVYETIGKVGNGSTYTECDGVARYRFHNSPTAQTTSFVTVTSVVSSVETLVRKEFYPHCEYEKEAMCGLLEFWASENVPRTADPEGFDDVKMPPGAWTSRNRDRPDAFPSCRLYWEDCHFDMGDEVILIYFPQPPSPTNSCGSSNTQPAIQDQKTFITSAITFSGQDLYLRASIENGTTWLPGDAGADSPSRPLYVGPSVLPGPFTFISPNVYLAHRPIKAILPERGGGKYDDFFLGPEQIEEALPAGVITMNPNDVYSILPKGGQLRGQANYAQLVAHGLYSDSRSHFSLGETPDGRYMYKTEDRVPFDFANLRNPVPASVFYDARADDCWGKQTHCETITDDSYRPQIVIRNKVWSSALSVVSWEYRWPTCLGPRLADPPLAIIITVAVQPPRIPAKATKLVWNEPSPGSLPPPAMARPGEFVDQNGSRGVKSTAWVGQGYGSRPGTFGFDQPPNLVNGVEYPRITPGPKDGQAGHKSGSRPQGQAGGADFHHQIAEQADRDDGVDRADDDDEEEEEEEEARKEGSGNNHNQGGGQSHGARGDTQKPRKGGQFNRTSGAVYFGASAKTKAPHLGGLMGIFVLVVLRYS